MRSIKGEIKDLKVVKDKVFILGEYKYRANSLLIIFLGKTEIIKGQLHRSIEKITFLSAENASLWVEFTTSI